MSTEPTSLRLDTETKNAAYEIFDQVGLKPAQAVNLFFRQVVLNDGLPFPINIPNSETKKAMQELEESGGEDFKDSDELYKDLGIG